MKKKEKKQIPLSDAFELLSKPFSNIPEPQIEKSGVKEPEIKKSEPIVETRTIILPTEREIKLQKAFGLLNSPFSMEIIKGEENYNEEAVVSEIILPPIPEVEVPKEIEETKIPEKESEPKKKEEETKKVEEVKDKEWEFKVKRDDSGYIETISVSVKK